MMRPLKQTMLASTSRTCPSKPDVKRERWRDEATASVAKSNYGWQPKAAACLVTR